MELFPRKRRWSPFWFLVALLIAALIGLRVDWLVMPPKDPEFSWQAMHSPRDIGYVEVESWRIDHDCLLEIIAPNGSVYPIPRGCKLDEALKSWEVKLRMACKWRVETEDALGLLYVGGAHSDCQLMDIQYLQARKGN